MRLVNHYSL